MGPVFLSDLHSFDQARSSLLGPSLARVDKGGARIKCHRLVQLAVAKSMSPQTISIVFHQLVFFLNASFPRQADGRPLLDQWGKCEELSSQVEALLESYKQYQKDLGEPILLCEIICRCAWWVFAQCPVAAKIHAYKFLGISMREDSTRAHCGWSMTASPFAIKRSHAAIIPATPAGSSRT